MWLWLFAGVHNDAKPIQCRDEGGRRAVDNGWEGVAFSRPVAGKMGVVTLKLTLTLKLI